MQYSVRCKNEGQILDYSAACRTRVVDTWHKVDTCAVSHATKLSPRVDECITYISLLSKFSHIFLLILLLIIKIFSIICINKNIY